MVMGSYPIPTLRETELDSPNLTLGGDDSETF